MKKIVETNTHYVLTIDEICRKFGIKEEIITAILPYQANPKKLLLYPKKDGVFYPKGDWKWLRNKRRLISRATITDTALNVKELLPLNMINRLVIAFVRNARAVLVRWKLQRRTDQR